ncbi:MAG: BamA/TamA family outer membrane protein [Bacteroidia bacterium]|nr:BamA/TamA family outer membrane protein [Bacteroidia bacterium]
MKKFILVILLLSGNNLLRAQQVLKLFIRFEPNNTSLQKTFYRQEHADTFSLLAQLNGVLATCYQASYLLANIHTFKWSYDSALVTIDPGKSFKLVQLRQGNVPAEWLSSSGFRIQRVKGQPYIPALQTRNLKAILVFAQNNGFPFATIGFDSIIIDSGNISASLKLDKNVLVYFDSLDYGGSVQIKKRFLQNYSGINPGAIYNESLLAGLDARLSELPFLKVTRPLVVYFYGSKARTVVYLDNRKASSFDGIIGFAPNSSLNNKLVITGDINLKLQNLLGSGKTLELNFRSFLSGSQDLQLKFVWPYFLNTKLGIDYAFKLLKFDTTYLDVFNDIGLQYRFTGNNYLKVFYQVQTVSLLQVDTSRVLATRALPAFNDIRNDLYGIGIRRSRLNYFLNPSKGYLLEIDGGVGTKKILRNNTIDALLIPAAGGESYKLYDSIKLVSLQYKANLNLSVFFKLPYSFVLHTQIKSAVVYAQNLFINELFRIGGLKTLKGFDEQSIFANKYGIANIELRYLFQKNSSFILLWNGAWYQNDVRHMSDKPWGLGAGMNIETGAGIFSLYYALGKQLNNPFEISNGKIHFGFINYF